MKDKTMNKLINLVAGFTLVAGVAAAQQATTTTTTGSLFSAPALVYVSATVVSTTDPVIITLPSTGRTLLTHACDVLDSADRLVPRDLEVSSSIRIDDAAGMTSGTLAVGDKVKCVLGYQR